MADRRLAGTEALDLGLGLHLGELGPELGGEIGRRQHDLEFLLQTLRGGLRYLHVDRLLQLQSRRRAPGRLCR
ncbi:hypothetical protein WOA01_14410 [Methylocystis sp. IM2]|uniref:hypothetical protein n=1 Tax=unclassified Methylocystis TaxID=2625913 RepID=UPI0030FABC22